MLCFEGTLPFALATGLGAQVEIEKGAVGVERILRAGAVLVALVCLYYFDCVAIRRRRRRRCCCAIDGDEEQGKKVEATYYLSIGRESAAPVVVVERRRQKAAGRRRNKTGDKRAPLTKEDKRKSN